ncbi:MULTISPECIES: glycosyltransferase [unclassified Bacillus (in: firmicutes)]|uniref:glycosyltransferase n=1 Tax=unclassified Bacillus (in: firmicutes) TaxID=185979 RepID=UPI0008EF8D06|nr:MULTISPECIES: glycosyltransferase [unclassified Bacillus (in: firmicutes)]SFB04705.1 Glycosyltransferase involved in cell wall bisynthesis [Bacillus sp. UNCCL13]SFQ88431.1 Glycosyltransferase involved in cell wall bisynthesis [Bacillus sp. cl95]
MNLVFVHDHKFYKFNDHYYSNGGLSGDALNRYIKAFGNVTIIARCLELNEINNNLSFASVEGTRFVSVPNHKSINSFYKIRDVKKIIEREIKSADYVIARSSTLGNMAVSLAIKYKKPYLVEVVGCAWDSMWNYNIKGKVLAPLSFYTMKKSIKDAPYAIYVTNEFLQKRYPTKGKYVNCSNVTLSQFDPSLIEKRIKKIKGLQKNSKTVFGTIGAVNINYKGQKYVIEALGKLKKQGITNFEYHLVGGGNQQHLLSVAQRAGVSEEVKFIGSLPHERVFDWLDNIDLYIQPSVTEGLPRALIEAMSRGLPAIGSNAGGIPELLSRECIFSKKSTNEIQYLIKNMSQSKMEIYAKENFEEAKKYSRILIENRRNEFFNAFISENLK